MTKRMTVALASCLALAACGGGSSGGNAAAGKTFSYGAATTYSTSSLDTKLSGAVALGSTPDATSAQNVASVDSITANVLGDSGVGLAMSPTQQQAFAAGARTASRQLAFGSASGFDNPTCVTTSATGVVMKGCTVTTSSYGETVKVQVNGSISFDQATGTLSWDYTVNEALTYTSSSQSLSAQANLHESGTLVATATTLKGDLLAELSATASSGGSSASLAVSEAVNVDVTYADPTVCATRVTGGTLEAKRVFTDRGGFSATVYPDRAAKITWTGCGTGSFQYSWK